MNYSNYSLINGLKNFPLTPAPRRNHQNVINFTGLLFVKKWLP